MKNLTFFALFLTGFYIWPQLTDAKTLAVPGTGACESILRKIAVSYNNQASAYDVVIPPSTGSTGGIVAVINGESVLARVARPLREQEIRQGLSYRVFSKDGIVFAVGSKVDVESLTKKQLVDIFSGKIKNWQQVGASNAYIRVLLREEDDSSLRIVQKHIDQFKTINFTDEGKTLYHEYEMVEALLKYKRSIGWLAQSSIPSESGIKPISIDNIKPNEENILLGRYALVGECAIVYKEENLTALANSFLDYLFSKESKQILRENGLVPVSRH